MGLFSCRGVDLAARWVTEFAHNVFTEDNEQDNQSAKIQTEEATFQDNH